MNTDRARDDARVANEFGRSAIQACILINGGAATAVLAYSHDASRGNIFIALALFGYATGVFFGAIAFPTASKALSQWMLIHEDRSASSSAGDYFWKRAMLFVFSGLMCFAGASVLMALSFVWR